MRTNPFTIKQQSNLIEVWLGQSNDAESEHVLTIHESLLSQLIATLTSAKTKVFRK